MKKISLAIALVAVLALVFAATAFAGTAKATGGVQYTPEGHFLNFNVHENKTGTKVWGNVKNRTPDGSSYHAKVCCVNVISADTVLFAAEIVASDIPGISVGNGILIQVKDGGSPGTKGDIVWGQLFSTAATAAAACATQTTPSLGPYAVLSGNLVVHK